MAEEGRLEVEEERVEERRKGKFELVAVVELVESVSHSRKLRQREHELVVEAVDS